MSDSNIPFNKLYISGNELDYIERAQETGFLSGDGPYTKLCNQWLEKHLGAKKALLTHSCTAALEMAAILANIGPGDEVILPSYTFVSSANAFVLRGGIPVFVDVHPETLNINEKLIESAITSKTRAIIPVHYAGVACEMDSIMQIARHYKLLVIEDAAQAIMSTYKGKMLGTIGHMGCLSFHGTKNIVSGEGGALLINDESFLLRAEVIREKGTNRNRFINGEVDKYTWEDLGSSFLPGEMTAAFLFAQLQSAKEITDMRLSIWNSYHKAFKNLNYDWLQLPNILDSCQGNGHMYYLILNDINDRDLFIKKMDLLGINCVFHYSPLHLSKAGKKYCKSGGVMEITEKYSDCIVRLPIWAGLSGENLTRVIKCSIDVLDEINILSFS